MTRTLDPAPRDAIDLARRAPRYGSYRGSIPSVDLRPLAPNPLARIARHKRWIYAAASTPEVFVAVAVVRLGYSATAFTYVYDAAEGRILAHASTIGPTLACSLTNDHRGVRASFTLGARRFLVEKSPAGDVSVAVRADGVEVDARLDASGAPEPITAVAKVPDGVVDVTEKRTLLAARGHVSVRGRRFSLDGGLGGFDLTQGLLARRTMWRWAFALGRADDGSAFGMNLVRGFAGEAECAVWSGDALIPVGEGVITFDPASPREPWRVTSACGAVDLTFTPRDFHREERELVLVSSRFVQGVGTFEGTVSPPGRAPLRLSRVIGVTEDQDTTW